MRSHRLAKIKNRGEDQMTKSEFDPFSVMPTEFDLFTVMPNGEWLCEILQDGPEKYPILNTVMPTGQRLGDILSRLRLKLVTVDGQRVD
jgi:hypothetical protein